jgi:hypothetical protein
MKAMVKGRTGRHRSKELIMLTAAFGEFGVAPAGSRGHGVRRAVARMTHSRDRQMPRFVNGYQLSLDDAALATFGFDRETVSHGAMNAIV